MTPHQHLEICHTSDGVRIACARHGSGPPLVKVAHWMTHAEHDWESPIWRPWLRELGQRHTVFRYDARGTGLSDRDVAEVSLDAWVSDLEAVVDHADVERFPLFAMCQAGPVAIAYAARHPERVTRLVLYGTYAVGRFRRGRSERLQAEALLTLMREQWASDNPALRYMWASRFIAEPTPEQLHWFARSQRESATGEEAVRHMRVRDDIDVADAARSLTVPTLVAHARNDALVPFEMGRQLAGLVPGSELVPMQSRNHLLVESEPAWAAFFAAYDDFFTIPRSSQTPAAGAMDALTARERDVLALVSVGLSNDAISERLVLSPRTVERHHRVSQALDDLPSLHLVEDSLNCRDLDQWHDPAPFVSSCVTSTAGTMTEAAHAWRHPLILGRVAAYTHQRGS